jgi:isopropylmalate/homocitrate/citramalate synthase
VERWWHNNLTPEWDWPYAQVAIRLAKSCLNTDPARAQTLLENAIARLKDRHQAEIREQGLHALLAQAYQNQQKPELLGRAALSAP